MKTITVRFEYNPGDISDVLGNISKAWNGNPGSKVVNYSSGLVSLSGSTQYIEFELETLEDIK